MSAKEDRERTKDTIPSRLPETTPQVFPGQNYDFTLQAVFEMQKTVGKLTEAVETLKDQSKHHGDKLDKIGNDVHAAKVVLKIVGAAIVAFIAFCGWMIYEFLPILRDTFHKP